jgi:murein DD-endopeptidase MepM/ murein hydrolase activator NlpD
MGVYLGTGSNGAQNGSSTAGLRLRCGRGASAIAQTVVIQTKEKEPMSTTFAHFAAVLLLGFALMGCEDAVTTSTPGAKPALSLADPAVTGTQTSTGFFYPTGNSTFSSGGGHWLEGDGAPALGNYTSGEYHLGFDMMTSQGLPVFAISRGIVKVVDGPYINGVRWDKDFDNKGLLIEHTLADGSKFYAAYGHIATDLEVGNIVSGGVEIGTIGPNYPNNHHLHFGVASPYPIRPFGSNAESKWPAQNNFVDPLNWITTRTPKCENGTSARYRPNGPASYPRHPMGSLLKTASSQTVYVLVNGQRRGIATQERLWELYGPGRGFDHRDVITAELGELNYYPLGSTVSGPLPGNGRSEPDGRLIRYPGSPEISIVTDNGMRRPFSNLKAFLALGYTFCNVANVSDYYTYPVGSPITQ